MSHNLERLPSDLPLPLALSLSSDYVISVTSHVQVTSAAVVPASRIYRTSTSSCMCPLDGHGTTGSMMITVKSLFAGITRFVKNSRRLFKVDAKSRSSCCFVAPPGSHDCPSYAHSPFHQPQGPMVAKGSAQRVGQAFFCDQFVYWDIGLRQGLVPQF